MIGFWAIARADEGADPRGGAGQTMASWAGGLYPSDEFMVAVALKGLLSAAAVIWPEERRMTSASSIR